MTRDEGLIAAVECLRLLRVTQACMKLAERTENPAIAYKCLAHAEGSLRDLTKILYSPPLESLENIELLNLRIDKLKKRLYELN